MSNSQFVCWKDGAPVHSFRNSWKHSLGGRTGAIPAHRKHRPVPILRSLYDEAYSPNVTRERFQQIRAIAERTYS